MILSIKEYWTRLNNTKGAFDGKQTPKDIDHTVMLENFVCKIWTVSSGVITRKNMKNIEICIKTSKVINECEQEKKRRQQQ